MATTMDENTVTANLVTFVNCLSLAERKVITSYLFGVKCFVEDEKPNFIWIEKNQQKIQKAKKIKWEISYHTSIFEGCQPDITITIDGLLLLFIEVKTKVTTKLTFSEMKGGTREKYIKPECHLYLLPNFYDFSNKIINSPVCYWRELKIFFDEEQINSSLFFKEIGKYIDNFSFYKLTLSTGELSMLYESKYVHDSIQLLTKIHKLIADCDNDIICALNSKSENSFKPSDFSGYGKDLSSYKWIHYMDKYWLGYGFYDELFDNAINKDNSDIEKYIFCVFIEKDILGLKSNEGIDFIENTHNFVFYPIDKKILSIQNFDEMKKKYIDAVVSKFLDIMSL